MLPNYDKGKVRVSIQPWHTSQLSPEEMFTQSEKSNSHSSGFTQALSDSTFDLTAVAFIMPLPLIVTLVVMMAALMATAMVTFVAKTADSHI